MLRILAGKRRGKHQINSAHFLRTKEAEGECVPNDLRSPPCCLSLTQIQTSSASGLYKKNGKWIYWVFHWS